MKLEINVQAKEFEVASVMIGRALDLLEQNPQLLETLKMSKQDIYPAKKIHEKLLNSFLKKH